MTPNRDWKRRHAPEIGLFQMLQVVSVICIVYQFNWPNVPWCRSDTETA